MSGTRTSRRHRGRSDRVVEQESEGMTSANELLDEYYGDVKKPNKIFKALDAMVIFYVTFIGWPLIGVYFVYSWVKLISALVRVYG